MCGVICKAAPRIPQGTSSFLSCVRSHVDGKKCAIALSLNTTVFGGVTLMNEGVRGVTLMNEGVRGITLMNECVRGVTLMNEAACDLNSRGR